MNTLYVLKGGMKFKFLALTVVVLLGLGVGNTAWGQDKFYTCNDGAWNGTEVWENTSDCTGAFVPAPNPTANNLEIYVNHDLVVSGGLSYSTNFRSFTVNGTLIVDGNLSFPDGSSNGITVGSSGLLIVKGSLTHGGNGGVQIASGGRLVVYKNANIQCAMTVNGQFNVSGDFNYSGNHTFTLNGDVIVGKDATFTNIGNVAFNTNSYIGILGNAVFSAQNNPTINGEIDVIGTVSGTKPPGSVTNNIETQAPVDPIMNVFYGMDVIAFLTGSDISTNTYTNSSGDAYSGVIWTSDNYQTFCYLNVILSGEIKFSNIASKGTAYFEYSVDDGYTWTTGVSAVPFYSGNLYRKDDINAPSQMVRMRLVANGLPADETVTISNITIAATNEGSEDVYPIKWPTIMPRDICDGEQAVYEILNPGDYDDIRWNYPDKGYVEIVSISPNKARCEVKWISSPGTLNVTVTGGSCGGASASITYPINVNEPTAFSASYSKTDISCFGDGSTPNDGSITLSGCGGTGIDPIAYLWTDGPGYPFADNTLATQDNLSEGTYKATVSKGAVSENLEITISRPAELSVSISNAQAFLCAADAITGQFDISYSGGTWPYSIKIEKDGSEVATYNGTTPTATSGTLTWNPGGTLTYSGLGIGTYTVTLTGAVANGCPVATATLTIEHDDENPTFTNFPPNVQMTMAAYQAAAASMTSTLDVGTGVSSLNSTTTTVTRTLESGVNLYHNLKLLFNVSQSGATPAVGDVLKVEVSYDEGGSWPFSQSFTGAVSGLQTLDLGMAADAASKIHVKFTVTIFTTSLQYSISNVKISGLSFGSPNPPGCNDNSGSCTVTYTDSDPQWSTCSGYTNNDAEFHIIRTWRVADDCNNNIAQNQIISIGNAPSFNVPQFPADRVFDFCKNNASAITQTAPVIVNGGTCGLATVSWVVVKEISPSVYEEINSQNAHGTGDLSGYVFNFPYNTDGETSEDYYIVWTVTDQSYNKAERMQKITIKPAIAATITAPNLDNVCKDENVVFTVTPRGGTGTFNDTSFTPAGGTWNGTTYIFTTSLANVQEDETVTVRIQDVAVAGVDGVCNQDVLSPEFEVHDLIPTGGIIRE